jgi:hypothetical protein
MSASIYYTAFRDQPLSSAENAAVKALIKKFSIEDQMEEYFQTGTGLNWESFCVYDRRKSVEPGIVFQGATKLPDNSEDAVLVGLQHWCQLLSEIRNAVPGANPSYAVQTIFQRFSGVFSPQVVNWQRHVCQAAL